MAKFCSRLLGPRRNFWNTHEGDLLTTSILKQSRHLKVWRQRFATLTPKGIWTFKDNDQQKISDYLDFQEIVSIEHNWHIVVVCFTTHNTSLQFADYFEAAAWTQMIIRCAKAVHSKLATHAARIDGYGARLPS